MENSKLDPIQSDLFQKLMLFICVTVLPHNIIVLYLTALPVTLINLIVINQYLYMKF
jgi:hypothetical protein